MKTLIPLTAIAALAASGLTYAQSSTAAFSKPSGYVTQNLSQGFNAIGLTLQNQLVASGRFETVNQTSLVDAQLSISPVAGRLYVLEITSGSANGAIFEIPASAISGSTINVTTVPATNLTSLGITSSDTYGLRLAPTLEEIFTTASVTNGGVLQAGVSSGGADIVWIPAGPNTYTQYFLHVTGQFRLAGTTTPTPNVPVVYADGFFVQKRATSPASLTVTGQVKTTGTSSVLGQGFNLVSIVSPAGSTLANIGLEDDIQPGVSAIGADIVWVQSPSLAYEQFFRHVSGFWRNVAAPLVNLTPAQVEAVVLSEAILVQRRSTSPVVLDLAVPASYSGL